MKHSQTYTFSRSAALSLVASIAFALLTLACFQLRLDLATAAFLYLISIVLLSLQGSFLLSAVFSLIAVGCCRRSFRRHLMRSMRSCCAPAAGKASSCTPRQMEPTW